jgi:hypothetical protein
MDPCGRSDGSRTAIRDHEAEGGASPARVGASRGTEGRAPGTLRAEVVVVAVRWGSGRVRVAGAVLGAVLIGGCAGPTTPAPAGPPAPPSASPATTSATAPATPSDPTGQARALPVYYVTDTPAGPRLVREFRRLPVGADAGAAGTAAVTALLAEPTGAVPGHRRLWPDGVALAAPVTHADGVVTVDLTEQAAAPADPDLAVQQLVYTVTGALGTAHPVRLLVAGEPVPRLWGRVDTASPIPRADPYDVRLLVQIDEPAPGATVTSPVRVAGEAAVFEATVLWEVRRAGEVVRSGSTSTAEGQRFAPYAFTVALPPGYYEIRIAEDDPSDGAGRPVMTDTRRVTVTG